MYIFISPKIKEEEEEGDLRIKYSVEINISLFYNY